MKRDGHGGARRGPGWSGEQMTLAGTAVRAVSRGASVITGWRRGSYSVYECR